MPFLNTAQLAEALGVSRQAVMKAEEVGKIRASWTNEAGQPLFNLVEVEANWTPARAQVERPPSSAGGRPKGSGSPRVPREPEAEEQPSGDLTDAEKYWKARAAREAYTAQEKKLNVEQKKGLLIERAKVEEQGASLAGVLIGAMQSWPDRLAPELAGMSDPHDVHQMLMREVNNLIVEIRARLGAP